MIKANFHWNLPRLGSRAACISAASVAAPAGFVTVAIFNSAPVLG